MSMFLSRGFLARRENIFAERTGRLGWPALTQWAFSCAVGYDEGMRFSPRFRLRTLLILIALLAFPVHQFAWIYQRREFLKHHQSVLPLVYDQSSRCPWSLKLFGERGAVNYLCVPPDLQARASRLFPEAAFLRWIDQQPVAINKWAQSVAGQ
jgi:hypothetical protein